MDGKFEQKQQSPPQTNVPQLPRLIVRIESRLQSGIPISSPILIMILFTFYLNFSTNLALMGEER